MQTIVLTGGGTAGHVTPNLALIPLLKHQGYKVHYIGTNGMEKSLITQDTEVTYHSISTGKLRRYFDLKNISDPFRVIKGCAQAAGLLRKIKPVAVFSKGGYVAVPVVLAARLLHIPTVIHESDITPGLATKLSMGGAKAICVTFEKAAEHMDKKKVHVTGSPIRPELFAGDAQKAKAQLGFDDKPVLLFMGGSLGAKIINDSMRARINDYLKHYNIIHICGKGNLDEALDGKSGYRQFEYVSDELCNYFALASLIVSRAGSNSINEFLALRKPMLLIPLSRASSRGDQEDNAQDFLSHGYCHVLVQENTNADTLFDAVENAYGNREEMRRCMAQSVAGNGTQNVFDVLNGVINGK